jgi:thermostable 8-oxoguanine DNA glycosylase
MNAREAAEQIRANVRYQGASRVDQSSFNAGVNYVATQIEAGHTIEEVEKGPVLDGQYSIGVKEACEFLRRAGYSTFEPKATQPTRKGKKTYTEDE